MSSLALQQVRALDETRCLGYVANPDDPLPPRRTDLIHDEFVAHEENAWDDDEFV